MQPQQYIPFIAIGVALAIILLRNRKPRTLRPQFMWITPAIIVPLMAFAIWGTAQAPGVSHAPFQPIDWAVLAVALGLGGLAGWWRGRMTTIEKHADGTLRAQASPIGLILIVALVFGRNALRVVAGAPRGVSRLEQPRRRRRLPGLRRRHDRRPARRDVDPRQAGSGGRRRRPCGSHGLDCARSGRALVSASFRQASRVWWNW